MSDDAHPVLCKFVQVLQKVVGGSRRDVGDLPRRRVLPFGGSVLDGVLGNDPVLEFDRWWQPTYQDVGRAGAVTPDVLRGTRGFWWAGPMCAQDVFRLGGGGVGAVVWILFLRHFRFCFGQSDDGRYEKRKEKTIK